ncbi:MAG: ABC transporter ATP-binding protein [Planctomycetota bacterium]|jgi:NitT/TauT family transport system ATP-binding protein|nr:ABC transporter ATP-binding protein [Planctomycetota bacterium]
MSSTIDLPDYRDLPESVRAHMAALKERPVVLEVKELERSFESPGGPVHALKGIDFQVHRREFIAVIGASGCGKSTLIRLLAGLDHPTGGQVLLDGNAITGPGPERGMVFQGYTLFPWLSVLGNVMFGPKMRGAGDRRAESEARQWIEMVGLSDFVDAYPSQLSGGMKQRVAIARALANEPRILLMDEPFGALDAQTRGKLQAHLLQIWRQVNLTVLFITHDLEEAVYLADRILVLGARPGHVQEIIDVPVPRPRRPDQFLSPHFLSCRRRIEELIHPRHDRDELPIPKLTAVGDEVDS